MMSQKWYYTKDGERQGPVSHQQLKQLATSGDLQPTDLIWKEGMADWKEAGTIRKLFGNESSGANASPNEVPANGPPSLGPTDQPGLLKRAKTKFAVLTTPQKVLVSGVGGMGVFFFLCMGLCGLGGLLGGFDAARQAARDSERKNAEKNSQQDQAGEQDQSSEPKPPVFSEGLAIVQKEGVWRVIDENNKTVGQVGVNAEATFRPFSNGRAVFSIHAGDYPPDTGGYSAPKFLSGAIDREGTIVIQPEFTQLTDFSSDRAVVRKGRPPEDRSGIIDPQGRFILPLTGQYDIGGIGGYDNLLGEVGFSEGLVYFNRNGGKGMAGGGFLDTEGRIAIAPEKIRGTMGSPGIFSEGLAAVQRGMTKAEIRSGFLPAGAMLIGYIDKTGKQVIEPKFEQARVFSGGLAAVQRSGEKWGYIDKTGKMLIGPKFDSASTFTNDRAAVTLDGKEKVIDRTGRIVR